MADETLELLSTINHGRVSRKNMQKHEIEQEIRLLNSPTMTIERWQKWQESIDSDMENSLLD